MCHPPAHAPGRRRPAAAPSHRRGAAGTTCGAGAQGGERGAVRGGAEHPPGNACQLMAAAATTSPLPLEQHPAAAAAQWLAPIPLHARVPAARDVWHAFIVGGRVVPVEQPLADAQRGGRQRKLSSDHCTTERKERGKRRGWPHQAARLACSCTWLHIPCHLARGNSRLLAAPPAHTPAVSPCGLSACAPSACVTSSTGRWPMVGVEKVEGLCGCSRLPEK